MLTLRAKINGRSVSLQREQIVIGRIFTDLKITSESASRLHAVLYVVGENQVRVRDLGSRNGTRLNGIKITDETLKVGDQLMIGGVEIEVVSLEIMQENSFTPTAPEIISQWPDLYVARPQDSFKK